MTPLEIIVFIIALVSIGDIILGIARPKKMLGFLTKSLRGNFAWIIPLNILIVFLVFGYFITQQLTVIQIIPGLFLGVLLTKMVVTTHPKEAIPIVKGVYAKIPWFDIIIDLMLVVTVFCMLFFR
jgi:hypothetical protein